MKLITFDDIKSLNIDPAVCYKWVSEMIADKRSAELPPKISLHPSENVFCNFMPCTVPVMDSGLYGGVKVVNRYPERMPSLDSNLLLLDMESGEFLALMDANWITAMRTGAVAVHSINLFAKKDFKKISFMGLGNTARATMLVLAHIFPERDFEVKLLKYKDQADDFAERFKDYKNLHFSFVDNYRDLVKGADVVVSCVTYFADDCCTDDCFDEGVLVVPVHTRGFTNCDLFFDKVFADDTGHVCGFRNFDKFKSFSEVCDVVNGINPGRENDKERILAYNIGLAIHDIYYASKIYDILKDNKKLPNVDMCSPTEKFWL